MRDIGKWPRLLVVGDPVTEEQANEILIRCDNWWISSNDRQWVRQVAELAGLPLRDGGFMGGDWQAIDAFHKRIGRLELEYLGTSRIASSWFGGPHGWCDWYGQIFTTVYNIGKWPTVEAVREDWETLAEAFPYLNLRAQLVGDEGEDDAPAVEWTVSGGTVAQNDNPDRFIARPGEMPLGYTQGPDGPVQVPVFMMARGERGVSLERLEKALTQVTAARSR